MSLSFKKNWSSMLLPFISGVIFTALVFSFSGSASTQESVGDFQGDFRNPIAQNAPVACNTTNCQLMTKLNQIHGRAGNSTWSLEALGYHNQMQTSSLLQRVNEVRGLDTNGQVSSWTIQSLSERMGAMAVQIQDVCQN